MRSVNVVVLDFVVKFAIRKLDILASRRFRNVTWGFIAARDPVHQPSLSNFCDSTASSNLFSNIYVTFLNVGKSSKAN